jgi:hypothetical protein
MLALYRSGRQVESLAVYRDARETLVHELGLEPGDRCRSGRGDAQGRQHARRDPAARLNLEAGRIPSNPARLVRKPAPLPREEVRPLAPVAVEAIRTCSPPAPVAMAARSAATSGRSPPATR